MKNVKRVSKLKTTLTQNTWQYMRTVFDPCLKARYCVGQDTVGVTLSVL